MTVNEKIALSAIGLNLLALVWGASKIATITEVLQKLTASLVLTSVDHEKRISYIEGASNVFNDSKRSS